MTTWDSIRVPAPISTLGPMMVQGPTSTSGASLAEGSMIAVGCIKTALSLSTFSNFAHQNQGRDTQADGYAPIDKQERSIDLTIRTENRGLGNQLPYNRG